MTHAASTRSRIMGTGTRADSPPNAGTLFEFSDADFELLRYACAHHTTA